MARKKPGTVISVFSGAMGLDLGLRQIGIHSSLAVELDQQCCKTIRTNMPDANVWETDVRQLDGNSLRQRAGNPDDVFLMVGGPPCQSFCPGGKRAALSDPRGNLIYTYLKLINEVRPQFFVLENVANIVTAALRHRPISKRPGKRWNLSVYDQQKHAAGNESADAMEPDELSGSAIRQVIADINDIDYHLNFAVVNAADYGAPQHRLRFIILGARQGVPPAIPPATHGNSSGLLPFRTVRDAIYDLREDPGQSSQYTEGVAKYFRMVAPGGHWRDIPRELQREALGNASFEAGGGKTGFFRRLAWDSPAPTITGKANRKGSALCHPDAVRPLSIKECARLQGFPDDWKLTGSMNKQYAQIGNAVPVQLGAAIGLAILNSVSKKSPALPPRQFDLELAIMSAVKRLRASARNKRVTDDSQLVLF